MKTQIQLIKQKQELEEIFFSAELSREDLNNMRKEIIRIGKQITPEPTQAKLKESQK